MANLIETTTKSWELIKHLISDPYVDGRKCKYVRVLAPYYKNNETETSRCRIFQIWTDRDLYLLMEQDFVYN